MARYLAAFVLGYGFLILSILIVGLYSQNLADSYSTDPDVIVQLIEARWHYWVQVAFAIISVFTSIVLVIGLHERRTVLIIWWIIYQSIYTLFLFIIGVFCTFEEEDPSYLVYHYIYAGVCFGILVYICVALKYIRQE